MERDLMCSLLGLLQIKDMTGYEIKKVSETTLSHFWSFSFSQIYPLLKKLQDLGFIEQNVKHVGKREKKIYSLTSEGAKALNQWRKEPHRLEEKKIPFLLKLFFSSDSENTLEHLWRYQKENEDKLERLKDIEAHLERYSEFGFETRHIKTLKDSLEFGLHITKAKLDWTQKKINDETN